MKAKRISINFAAEAMNNANTTRVALEEIFVGCRSLSGKGRQRMVKLGDGSEAFVGDVIHLAKNNLDLLPRGVSVAQVEQDLVSREFLQEFAVQLRQLAARLEHTEMMLGSDAMSAALCMYNAMVANGQEAGIGEELRAIGKRFAKKKQEEETDPVTPKPEPTPAAVTTE